MESLFLIEKKESGFERTRVAIRTIESAFALEHAEARHRRIAHRLYSPMPEESYCSLRRVVEIVVRPMTKILGEADEKIESKASAI